MVDWWIEHVPQADRPGALLSGHASESVARFVGPAEDLPGYGEVLYPADSEDGDDSGNLVVIPLAPGTYEQGGLVPVLVGESGRISMGLPPTELSDEGRRVILGDAPAELDQRVDNAQVVAGDALERASTVTDQYNDLIGEWNQHMPTLGEDLAAAAEEAEAAKQRAVDALDKAFAAQGGVTGALEAITDLDGTLTPLIEQAQAAASEAITELTTIFEDVLIKGSGDDIRLRDGLVTAANIVASQALSAKIAQFLEVEAGKITWDNAVGNAAFIASLVGQQAFFDAMATERLVVTPGQLLLDTSFNEAAWNSGTGSGALVVSSETTPSGGRVAILPAGTATRYPAYYANREPWRIPCSGGDQIVISMWVKADTSIPAESIRFGVQRWDAAGDRTAGTTATGHPQIAAGTWTRVEGAFTLPASARAFGIYVSVDAVMVGEVLVGDPRVERKVDAVLIEDGAVGARALAARIVLASEIIAGDGEGRYAVMDGSGFRVLQARDEGDPAQLVQLGVAGEGDFLTVADDGGMPLAAIDGDGVVAASGLQATGVAAAESFVMDGVDTANWVSDLSMKPVVSMTLATSAMGTGAGTSTFINGSSERRLLELTWTNEDTEDHQIWIPPLPLTLQANGAGRTRMRWRYTMDGTRPNVDTSDIAATSVVDTDTGFTQIVLPAVSIQVPAGTTYRATLTGYGSTGSRGYRVVYNGRVQLFDLGRAADAEGDWRVSVLGLVNESNANAGTGPGAVSPRKGQITKTFDISPQTNSQMATYWPGDNKRTTGTLTTEGSGGAIGEFGLWIIPPTVRTDIMSALSGADIVKIEVYVYFDWWYRSSGGHFGVNTHAEQSLPAASTPPSFTTVATGKTSRPGGTWLTLPINKHAGFQSGATKGFTVVWDRTSPGNEGWVDDDRLKLRVTYTPPSDTTTQTD